MQGQQAHSSRQWVQYAAACRQEVGLGYAAKDLHRSQDAEVMGVEAAQLRLPQKAGHLQSRIHSGLGIFGPALSRPFSDLECRPVTGAWGLGMQEHVPLGAVQLPRQRCWSCPKSSSPAQEEVDLQRDDSCGGVLLLQAGLARRDITAAEQY